MSTQTNFPGCRGSVTYAAIDPAAAYASPIRTSVLLPNVTAVVDHFRFVRLEGRARQTL
jgi:transposase